MNYSELLQLAKGWGNSVYDRFNIWRLQNIYESLLQIANKENISFNALVLQCCSYAINNYEKIGELSLYKEE